MLKLRLLKSLAGLLTVFVIHPPSIAWAEKASGDTVPPAEPAPRQMPATREFIAAMHRLQLGLPDTTDSSELKQYPIYDYLVAARLRRDLSQHPSEQLDTVIDGFMRTHAGLPVTRTLQHQWLTSLAQRRRWDWFLPRSGAATDPQLVCDRLTGRLATGDTERLSTEALARWSVPQRQPAECAEVFSWLRAQGLLTPALEETRARAALMAGNTALAHEFIRELPAERAAPLMQWLQLLESPRSSLNLVAMTPAMSVEPEALVAGFSRLTNMDSAAASVLLPLLLARTQTAPMLRARLQRAFALGAAYAHDPAAVAVFGELAPESSDAEVHEWRVRAALWEGAYEKALDWIAQMPASLANQPRWRYWRARAVAATQGAEKAAPLFADTASMRDFYGYLAADRLHQSYNLNIHPSADDGTVQTALEAEPGLIRAHALFDCDLLDEAALEWTTVLATALPAQRIQAARLASRWGWYAESIATLVQADDWDDVPLRYPRPYAPIVTKAAQMTQVPADWILAVMRQESLFRKDAVSRADARGLMQMQPATAVAVAKRWHLPLPGRDSLFEPTVAVPLGAAYVRELLDRYDNQLELSLAAYNAGPKSVARWLPLRVLDADIWIENIPYGETRSYVQHVLEHIVAFAVVRDAEPPHLAALLPPIMPAAMPSTKPAREAASDLPSAVDGTH
jgi:soluble lytic murein transglycosylase